MFCNKDNINWDDLDGLREIVKSFVKEKRYVHTLGVEEEAVKLAGIFEITDAKLIKKIKASAILHDITKEFDMKKQVEISAKYNFELNYDDIKSEKPVHSKTAAYIAKYEFYADDIIFNAIYNHTLGGPVDSFIADKIIYLADYIEINRTYGDCVEVREYFYSGIKNAETLGEKYKILDETILFSCNKTIEALIEENLFIHKDTVKHRNSFI